MAETRVDECVGDGEAVYGYLYFGGRLAKRGNVVRDIEDIKLVEWRCKTSSRLSGDVN